MEQSEILRVCEKIKQHLHDQGIRPIEDARVIFKNGTFQEFAIRYNTERTNFDVVPVGRGTVKTIILEQQQGEPITTVQSGRIELCTPV